MQHSVIMKVGENVIYQCSPYPKPMLESTASPVEFNRALPEWEQTAKNYLIKTADVSAFEEYIIPEQMLSGTPVPFDVIEIYPLGDKKYARYSKTPDRSLDVNDAGAQKRNPVVQNPLPQMQGTYVEKSAVSPVKKKTDAVAELVLSVNDDGEVSLRFVAFQNPSEIEGKLLNAFLKKAKGKGLVLNTPKLTEESDTSGNKGLLYELKVKE